jgi:hypothetical protein
MRSGAMFSLAREQMLEVMRWLSKRTHTHTQDARALNACCPARVSSTP